MIGSDCCCRLADISRARGHEVMVCDNLSLPYRDNCFDAVISIAVIHHFATAERRIQALQELARICRPGGLLMIYVWAMEQKHRKFDAQDVLVPWHLPQKHSKHKSSRSKVNGERLSQRSSSFTMGYQDQTSKNQLVFSFSPSGGVSSSDTSPVESPQHSSRVLPKESGGHCSQSKTLTHCLSDASLQPHSKSLTSMQESPLCASPSAHSLSSLVQDGETDGVKEDTLPPSPLRMTAEVESVQAEEAKPPPIYDDSYIDISYDKTGGVVKQRLFTRLNGQDGFLSEDAVITQSLVLEEDENSEREGLGGSLQNLGRFEMNPLLTVMRSLAHLEKSLSLPERELENGGSSIARVPNNDSQVVSNGHYKDLRILQLTSKQGSVGFNSVNAKGESFLKRTRVQGRSASFTHQHSRDSSMESLSSSDDSITTIPLNSRTEDVSDSCKVHLERRRQRRAQGLNHRSSRSVPGSPHVISSDSSCFFGASKSDSNNGEKADFSKYLRYYHVFREGELVELIDQHVPTLHVVKDYFDHANWCVVAEKVQCWTL
ncbi:uncharacterized protein [Apostichopus japonicus]